MRASLLALAASITFALAGCAGASSSPTVAPASESAASEEPELSSPSAVAEQEAPGAGETQQWIWACDSPAGLYATATVVVEVKNTGTTWVELAAEESGYAISDAAGGVSATGNFTSAYPTYLAPGATGYLADQPVFDSVKVADLKSVDVDVRVEAADENEAVVLSVSGVKLLEAGFGDGPIVSATVKNDSREEVRQSHAGAFFFDAGGTLIGFSETNLIPRLAAGASTEFQTQGGHCPPTMDAIAKTVVLAGPNP